MENIEKNKKVDSIQTELNFPDDENKEVEKVIEKVVEKDSKGRTREDIINILEKNGIKIKEDKEFPNCIVFRDKEKEYYVHGTLVDIYIPLNKKIFGPKEEIKKEEENISDRARKKAERREDYLYGRD